MHSLWHVFAPVLHWHAKNAVCQARLGQVGTERQAIRPSSNDCQIENHDFQLPFRICPPQLQAADLGSRYTLLSSYAPRGTCLGFYTFAALMFLKYRTWIGIN